MNKRDLIVSVCVITYNHEKYISQAIESVLMQDVNFCFEVVICDDHSLDNTSQICFNFKNNFPDIIKLTINPENKGMIPNFIQALRLSEGKYIALLEGDDYWTDPHKLQKQVDLLESNPEFPLCFHNSITAGSENQKERSYFINRKEGIYTYNDFLANDSFPLLASILFKNDPDILQPFINSKLKARDIILILHILEKGNAYYIDEVMSCRRLHDTGVWTSLNSYDKLITQINIRKEYLNYYRKHIYRTALSKNLINKLFLLNTLILKKHKVSKLILNTISILYYSVVFRHIKYSSKIILNNLISKKNNL